MSMCMYDNEYDIISRVVCFSQSFHASDSHVPAVADDSLSGLSGAGDVCLLRRSCRTGAA